MVSKSRIRFRNGFARTAGAAGLVALVLSLAPAPARAHGPVDPVASSYLARVTRVPAGLEAKVVDGDQRMWLKAPPGKPVLVLDYRGAPYLRYEASGVWVNRNSEMFYLNQTPPLVAPTGLTRTTRPKWVRSTGGDAYEWHDGRLHALASVALTPGSSYVGPWRIPLVVEGRSAGLLGGVWYRGAPSIVWFWPIAVLILCAVAAWRLHEPRIDAALARALAGVTLLGILLAALGRDLHGRPGLSPYGVFEFSVIAMLVAWTGWRVVRGRAGALTFLLVIAGALWEGVSLIPTLLHGYVLLAVPTVVGRLAAVICLGGAVALILPAVRLADRPEELDGAEPDADQAARTTA